MAYTAWSVVFGEQPTAAKWNQLGQNDAGFKDGTNFDSGIIKTTHLGSAANLAIPNYNLAPTAIKLGYAQYTSNFTTTTNALITSLSVAITMPAGGRSIKVTFFSLVLSNSSSPTNTDVAIEENGTEVARARVTSGGANYCSPGTTMAIRTPAAGASMTYTVRLYNVGGGTAQSQGSATSPQFLLVEAI